MAVFFDHLHHLAFPLPLARFKESLSLPQSDSRSLPRVLLYSVLAFACEFAESAPTKSQRQAFIAKARQCLEDITESHRPRDHILAKLILARTLQRTAETLGASLVALGENTIFKTNCPPPTPVCIIRRFSDRNETGYSTYVARYRLNGFF